MTRAVAIMIRLRNEQINKDNTIALMPDTMLKQSHVLGLSITRCSHEYPLVTLFESGSGKFVRRWNLAKHTITARIEKRQFFKISSKKRNQWRRGIEKNHL